MSNTMTKTHTKTMTKTKCSKDPSHAIFLKSREFKDIRYDAYNDKYNDQDKDDDKDKDKDNDNYIFLRVRSFSLQVIMNSSPAESLRLLIKVPLISE